MDPFGGLKSAILESAPALYPPRFEVKICDIWDSTQPAMTPPSTGMIFPVMADPASEQRKPTTDVSVKFKLLYFSAVRKSNIPFPIGIR